MGVATTLRAAAVQMDVRFRDLDHNLTRVLERLNEAVANGARLVVFPECCLSGYCFTSLEEARPFALLEEDERLNQFAAACSEMNVTGVLGFLEVDATGACFNSALIAVPLSHDRDGAMVSVYRKTHLPTLGVDRFVSKGTSLEPTPASWGSLGTLICYDVRFPEAVRSLALQGADVLALPTNWPEGAESAPDFITRARAWENRVWLIAANRVGTERGRRFIGRSQIVAPSGKILVEAGPNEETILYANLDLDQAREKRIVIEKGEWELDITGDRRPELYGALTEIPGSEDEHD